MRTETWGWRGVHDPGVPRGVPPNRDGFDEAGRPELRRVRRSTTGSNGAAFVTPVGVRRTGRGDDQPAARTSAAVVSPDRTAPSMYPFHTGEHSAPAQWIRPTGVRRACP